MDSPPKPQLKLNSRLLPALLGLLVVMQLMAPYPGWMILLIGLGGAWLLAYLWVWSLAQSLVLKREMRFGWAHVGDRLEERFTLINTGAIPALWVEISDLSTVPDYSASRVTGVDGHNRNRWHTQGSCTRRGIFTLGPTTVSSGDPLGLYTISWHYPESLPLTVTPPIVPLPGIEVAPGGRAGEGRSRPNAFERTVSVTGVRPYLPGDSVNWIHWPTSARKNSLYVRLFDSTPSSDWWLFLDLDERAQIGEDAASTTEHGIILAASLADRGLQQGRAVGLVTHGSTLTWLPPRSGDPQRQEILRALAVVTPGPCSLAELLDRIRPGFSQITSLIIITPAFDGGWVKTLLPLLRRGAVPTVLLLDPASFGAAAAARPTLALLTDLGITSHLIPRDLLDRPEARPGQRGQWEWRVSLTGRAVAVRRPRSLAWRDLGR
ncbi:MAG: DUF58 domain-containing protein [Chloroflexota bacterium]